MTDRSRMKRWLILICVVSALLALVVLAKALRTNPTVPAAAEAPALTKTPVLADTPAVSAAPKPTPAPTLVPTPTNTPAPTPFSFVWMGDTQGLASGYPDILDSGFAWVANAKEKENIVAVLHVGDIVYNSYNETQRERIAHAASLLSKDVVCVTAGGNHDRGMTPFYKDYLNYRFDTQLDAANAFGDGATYYTTFSAGGMKFIVVSVAYLEEKECLSWAKDALLRHSDHFGVLLVHSYLLDYADANSGGFTSSGKVLRDGLVKDSPNLRLVLCGHERGTAYRPLLCDDDGDGKPERTVHQSMLNLQDEPMAGSGYERLLTFDPIRDTIMITTYSPYLDDYGYKKDPLGEHFLIEQAGLTDFLPQS